VVLLGVAVACEASGQPATAPPATAAVHPEFVGHVRALPAQVVAAMRKHSWREGCPRAPGDLAYLEVDHFGYDGKVHTGELVVEARLAREVLDIMRELFQARFPIEKMRLIDAYAGSDEASMADNNTSAFNCRPVAGRSRGFSRHSYGRAIDINPLTNPYVKGKLVAPPAGRAFLDRTQGAVGMITRGDACHQAFVRRGWRWGGVWRLSKDYQHFEKPERN
jgi:hypothetical protein